MDKETLIAHAKSLAKANYEKSYGWSVFTECYDHNDYIRLVEDWETIEDVGTFMNDVAAVFDDRYEDAKNNASW